MLIIVLVRGPLGFPTGREAEPHGILNLGLHDQLAALQWVPKNVAHFGGDMTKITVMGESAGAASIQIHLQETQILGLTRAEILESGGIIPLFKPEATERIWEDWVAQFLAVLRAQQNITTTSQIFFFGPVIDGRQGLVAGRWLQVPPKAHLPLLLSTNLDEGTIFVPHDTNLTEEIRDEILTRISNPITFTVPHTSEIAFIFGTLANVSTQASALSATMQDYWISLATSLDPNNGYGTNRPLWPQYTPDNQVVIQFDGSGITTIPDDFRKGELAFFANNCDLLNT